MGFLFDDNGRYQQYGGNNDFREPVLPAFMVVMVLMSMMVFMFVVAMLAVLAFVHMLFGLMVVFMFFFHILQV